MLILPKSSIKHIFGTNQIYPHFLLLILPESSIQKHLGHRSDLLKFQIYPNFFRKCLPISDNIIFINNLYTKLQIASARIVLLRKSIIRHICAHIRFDGVCSCENNDIWNLTYQENVAPYIVWALTPVVGIESQFDIKAK